MESKTQDETRKRMGKQSISLGEFFFLVSAGRKERKESNQRKEREKRAQTNKW